MDQTNGMTVMGSASAGRHRAPSASSRGATQRRSNSSLGLYIGAGLMAIGWLLTMLGIADEVSWITAMIGNDSVIGSATPGLLVFAAGLTLIWFAMPQAQRDPAR